MNKQQIESRLNHIADDVEACQKYVGASNDPQRIAQALATLVQRVVTPCVLSIADLADTRRETI